MAGGKSDFCPDCGRPQPAGLCVHCWPAQASSSGTAADPVIASSPGPTLASLAATIGPIRRILLADTGNATAEPALVNPASREMPAPADRGVRVQLLGEIARGGMGVVLKGRDPDLGRDLAVKVLLETHKENPDLVRRFVEEAQIGGQLQHPGVVPVYELGTFGDGRPYFTMKLVKGRTLAELLSERKSPAEDLPRFLAIFEQICQTMAYAHARDVIHRDLKPSNVMVGSFGEVQVMDWGLAKVLSRGGVVDDAAAGKTRRTRPSSPRPGSATDSDLSQAGSVLGTPAYMAPEQARGEIDSVDERADVFALGSILCEILTGQPAFVGRSSGEIHRKAALADLADAFARLDAAECRRRAHRPGPGLPGTRGRRPPAPCRAAGRADDGLPHRGREQAAHGRDRPRHRRSPSRGRGQAARARRRAAREAQARAEESRRTAETAEAKAPAESRARRMTGALAAALLVLVLGRGGGYACISAPARHKRTRRWISHFEMPKSCMVRRSARRRRPRPLARVREAAHAVERLLADASDQTTRDRVTSLVQSVTAEARAAENDQQLLEELIDIRSATEDDPDWSRTDAAYSTAFRAADIDALTLPPGEIGARIKARPATVAVILSAALDDWARIRREKRHDRSGAERVALAARAADPDPWRNRLRDALDAPEGQKRFDALRDLARSAQVDDLPAVSLDLLGSALREAGDPQRAEAVLRRAQRRRPCDVWLNYNLAQCLEKLARRNEAIRFYMAARSSRPEVAHELAHALDYNGEPDEAIAVFQELTRIRPGNGRHLRCLGLALRKRGRVQEADTAIDSAIAVLREEIRQRPEDPWPRRNLGWTLSDRGKHQEAIAELRKALEIMPDDAELHDVLGSALRHNGEIDAAIDAFREAIRRKKDLARAHFDLGEALAYNKNENVAAEAEFREGIRLSGGDHSSYEGLGDILNRQSKFKEAIAELHIAARIDPTCGTVRRYLGDALRGQGKLEAAAVEYRQAFRLRPGDETALYEFAQILNDSGKLEVLIDEYRDLIRLHPDSDAALNSLAWELALALDRPARVRRSAGACASPWR